MKIIMRKLQMNRELAKRSLLGTSLNQIQKKSLHRDIGDEGGERNL